MSSLTAIKTRISSVKKTTKMTKVIKMISVSKLSNTKNKEELLKKSLEEGEKTILKSIAYSEHFNLYPSTKPQEQQNYIYIIFSSDSAMCGNLNTQIEKLITEEIKHENVKIYSFGKKITSFCSRKFDVSRVEGFSLEKMSNEEKEKQIDLILSNLNQENTKLKLIYCKFINNMSYKVELKDLFPINLDLLNNSKEHKDNINSYNSSNEEIVSILINKYIKLQTQNCLTSHLKSLHSTRINTAENATENGKQIIADLSTLYNKERQSKITSQLLDIISGSSNV
jgi:F-type H+-transporting ATPase subunit gamma